MVKQTVIGLRTKAGLANKSINQRVVDVLMRETHVEG